MHAWAEEKPLRLREKTASSAQTDPKAIACYGLWLPQGEQMLLRFVDGRPVSGVTCDFLAWVTKRMSDQGKRALVIVWDNASWHKSQKVRDWIKAHNRRVKKESGCRLLVFRLPVQSPWLNPIEPRWVHGKRAVVEPNDILTAEQLMERLCAYYQCEREPPLKTG